MDLFRITKKGYETDLSGEGAKIFGGRWNFKEMAVLYTSTSESLAALETLVHTPISTIPDDLHLIILSVPDSIKPVIIKREELPENWGSYPMAYEVKKIGSDWLDSKSGLMLKVPSAIIQSEWNVLLNPAHPEMKKVKIREIRAFTFDSRLLK